MIPIVWYSGKDKIMETVRRLELPEAERWMNRLNTEDLTGSENALMIL